MFGMAPLVRLPLFLFVFLFLCTPARLESTSTHPPSPTVLSLSISTTTRASGAWPLFSFNPVTTRRSRSVSSLSASATSRVANTTSVPAQQVPVQQGHSTNVADCTCGFFDSATNHTWTDAIITFANETTELSPDVYVVETFQHKYERNINAVYRFGSRPENVEFANASIPGWNSTTLQLLIDPPTKDHAVVGASIRTLRRDILFGSFHAYMRPPGPWAGGSALTMAIAFNDSQSIDITLMNADNPDLAWSSFLINGEYKGSVEHGVNFSDYGNASYNYKGSPWDLVPYRIEWNSTRVEWFLGDAMVRNVTKKTKKPPLAPAPLYFQHWSLGDKYSSMGPPQKQSHANIAVLRAFFNSSLMSKEDHEAYDQRCNFMATCQVSDYRLRGATTYNATSTAKFKEAPIRYTARWPAIFLLSISASVTLILLIHTFFKRAPWKKATVEHGHGAPAAPPAPPTAPERRKSSARPKPTINFAENVTLLGAAATPGAVTPGNLTPGMTSPGLITPRAGTPPPESSTEGEKVRLPSFADFRRRSTMKLYDEDEKEGEYSPNGRSPSKASSSSSSSETLGDGPAPEIRVTRPSLTGVKARLSTDSSRYSRSLKSPHGYDDDFVNPFEDSPKSTPKAIRFAETEMEDRRGIEKEMDDIRTEFENYDGLGAQASMERTEVAERPRKAPKNARVDYLAGLVAVGCLMVSMAHVALTFLPAVQQGEAVDAHYSSERFAYKFITPFLLLFSWIGPFFTTSARFLVWHYLKNGDLLNVAEKVVGRAPRLIIPCACIAALQYFLMQVGAVSWLDYLPSVTWSTWPYTSTYPNFGHFLSEIMQLMYIIPNAVPVITFNYCTGVLWTIPVQLQNSWLTLIGAIMIYEIKTPWKRFSYYTICVVTHWYAISWGSFFWLGLAIADLDITYMWKKWIYARPGFHYPMLIVCFVFAVGSQSTDLVGRFKTFNFDVEEKNIHPDVLTGRPIGQTSNVGYPPYYMPRLSALTFALGLQLMVELSPFFQRMLSAKWLMHIFPHVMTIYLIHGFVFWSYGAWVCVHLSAAGLPYWANMLVTILTSYLVIFLSLPILSPLVDTVGKTISADIWENASTKPPPRRRTLFPFPIDMVDGARENDGGNLKDLENDRKMV